MKTINLLQIAFVTLSLAASGTMLHGENKRIRPVLFTLAKSSTVDLEKAIIAANEAFHKNIVAELQQKLATYKGVPDALQEDLRFVQDQLAKWTPKTPIPAWVENILVVEREDEYVVAFGRRDNGFSVADDGSVKQRSLPTFTCFVNKKTFHAVVRAEGEDVRLRTPNIYIRLEDGVGLLTTKYPDEPRIASPLNRNPTK